MKENVNSKKTKFQFPISKKSIGSTMSTREQASNDEPAEKRARVASSDPPENTLAEEFLERSKSEQGASVNEGRRRSLRIQKIMEEKRMQQAEEVRKTQEELARQAEEARKVEQIRLSEKFEKAVKTANSAEKKAKSAEERAKIVVEAKMKAEQARVQAQKAGMVAKKARAEATKASDKAKKIQEEKTSLEEENKQLNNTSNQGTEVTNTEANVKETVVDGNKRQPVSTASVAAPQAAGAANVEQPSTSSVFRPAEWNPPERRMRVITDRLFYFSNARIINYVINDVEYTIHEY
ncbi:conserved hypothetical protein [Trichinella spiralis]|uniref:hypothetical protein n=1 Tax=Trichinella spiralis TaxID=6334 RepID=UPI0001EFDDF8|nr:conserved hypothetical protein [Trichinella spiralis]